MGPRTRAILQALLVTFLWSTSWVLIKLGLVEIPALTFAGLRYSLAFLCLLPFAWHPSQRASLRSLTARQWRYLVVYGLLFYAIVQGAQFIALAHLPAASVSLILNFTALFVAVFGLLWLAERPGALAWVGILLLVAGGVVFFYPAAVWKQGSFGLLVAVIGMFANAGSAVLGRYINHKENLPALTVTLVSMGVGGFALLAAGGIFQGIPLLSWKNWAIIGWLAVVNTAFAFTLWNHTLKTLSATESSVINSTMLIQIAVLAWLFLGETLNPQQLTGMALASVGVVFVQIRRRR